MRTIEQHHDDDDLNHEIEINFQIQPSKQTWQIEYVFKIEWDRAMVSVYWMTKMAFQPNKN